jgi:hypothetical protein
MSNYQPPQGGQPAGFGQQPGQPYQSPEFEPQPPRQGMGCGTKVLIALGIAFALALLLCCGIVGYFVYYVKSSLVEDPAEVAAMTDEITQIDIPQPLRPTGGGKFKIPFTSKVIATAVFYADQPSGSMLMLMAMGDAFDENGRAQIEQSFRQQSGQKQEGEQLIVTDTQRKELTIRGEPAAFTITSGVGEKSRTPRMRVQGTFRGKTGPVMLVSDMDANTFGQEGVAKLLESIK